MRLLLTVLLSQCIISQQKDCTFGPNGTKALEDGCTKLFGQVTIGNNLTEQVLTELLGNVTAIQGCLVISSDTIESLAFFKSLAQINCTIPVSLGDGETATMGLKITNSVKLKKFGMDKLTKISLNGSDTDITTPISVFIRNVPALCFTYEEARRLYRIPSAAVIDVVPLCLDPPPPGKVCRNGNEAILSDLPDGCTILLGIIVVNNQVPEAAMTKLDTLKELFGVIIAANSTWKKFAMPQLEALININRLSYASPITVENNTYLAAVDFPKLKEVVNLAYEVSHAFVTKNQNLDVSCSAIFPLLNATISDAETEDVLCQPNHCVVGPNGLNTLEYGCTKLYGKVVIDGDFPTKNLAGLLGTVTEVEGCVLVTSKAIESLAFFQSLAKINCSFPTLRNKNGLEITMGISLINTVKLKRLGMDKLTTIALNKSTTDVFPALSIFIQNSKALCLTYEEAYRFFRIPTAIDEDVVPLCADPAPPGFHKIWNLGKVCRIGNNAILSDLPDGCTIVQGLIVVDDQVPEAAMTKLSTVKELFGVIFLYNSKWKKFAMPQLEVLTTTDPLRYTLPITLVNNTNLVTISFPKLKEVVNLINGTAHAFTSNNPSLNLSCSTDFPLLNVTIIDPVTKSVLCFDNRSLELWTTFSYTLAIILSILTLKA